jgi:arginine-tRNA-protein transferase
MDELLSRGYRRSGRFFYRTQCPACSACESTRLNPATFRPTRSQRRAGKKGDEHLETRIGVPVVDQRRLDLFNQHRQQRKLDHGGAPVDAADYSGFLLSAPCDSVELSFWLEDELIAISITDVASESFSAVYCYFDPAASALALERMQF